jgi:hypothetical protein
MIVNQSIVKMRPAKTSAVSSNLIANLRARMRQMRQLILFKIIPLACSTIGFKDHWSCKCAQRYLERKIRRTHFIWLHNWVDWHLHGDSRELFNVARNTWWLLRHLFVLHLLSPFYSLCRVYGRSLADGFVCLWTESWMAILLKCEQFLVQPQMSSDTTI